MSTFRKLPGIFFNASVVACIGFAQRNAQRRERKENFVPVYLKILKNCLLTDINYYKNREE